MFTDIVGYTTLAQADESKALKILEEHRRLLRPVFARYMVREVKTIGDAFLVEFASALEATQSSVEFQRLVSERNEGVSKDDKLMVRVGIHVGEVVHSENDAYGDAVNVASRIEPLAEPGGICITQHVYDHVRNKGGLQIVRLGPIELKNVKLPIEIYKIIPSWRALC